MIARCTGAGDVAAALDFARSHELEVAVRGGGHSPAGHCLLDDGLVIDLTALRAVEVDADARMARSGGGATWLDFDGAVQVHALATPGGVVGTTGVTGLTFGGGIGHLTAQHGLTCDGLLGAEIVTPSGEVVHAGADGDHELLWGLRGGGGNFGVATTIELRLHPVERVIGGRLSFLGDGVREALRRFRDLVAGSPSDLSCQALLELDESGAPTVDVVPCYTGSDSEPEGIAELRASPGLAGDSVRMQGFLEQQRIFDPLYGEERQYWKGHFIRELPDELIDALVERIQALGRPPGQVLIESLHGAPKDADPDTAALNWRDAAFNITAMGIWTDPSHDEEGIAWARETAAAIQPWSVSGGYVNYSMADEPTERVRAAFGDERFERLQALKARYDPDNLLRRNQNIPPA